MKLKENNWNCMLRYVSIEKDHKKRIEQLEALNEQLEGDCKRLIENKDETIQALLSGVK